MKVTESGIETEVNEVQPRKASYQIFVTEDPTITDVNFGHLAKAPPLISVTPFGMIKFPTKSALLC